GSRNRRRQGPRHSGVRSTSHLRTVLSRPRSHGRTASWQWPGTEPGEKHCRSARRDDHSGERPRTGQRLHPAAPRPGVRPGARGRVSPRVRSPTVRERRATMSGRPVRRALPARFLFAEANPMRRVLIIEDEPGLVLALTQRLTSEGYDVETVADGEQGLARGVIEPFDCIILDLML